MFMFSLPLLPTCHSPSPSQRLVKYSRAHGWSPHTLFRPGQLPPHVVLGRVRRIHEADIHLCGGAHGISVGTPDCVFERYVALVPVVNEWTVRVGVEIHVPRPRGHFCTDTAPRFAECRSSWSPTR